MPLVKRRFHIPCRGDECLKIYELLKDYMGSIMYAELRITSKGLVMETYSYETDIKNFWIYIRRLIGSLREASGRMGMHKYSVELLTKMSRATFPPRLLVELLRRLNYSAEFSSEESAIITNASIEKVLELIGKIVELNSRARELAETTSARYYLVACSILTGKPLTEVVKLSLSAGIIKSSDKGKYSLELNWREALDSALKSIKDPS